MAVLTRLLVLWLLAEGPRHGYQVKKALEDEALALWFPVDFGSIYTVLRTLVRKGWAREVRKERPGTRPPRTPYAITSAGRERYREMLRDALATLTPPSDPACVALAAEGDLTATEVVSALRAREAALKARLARLAALRRAAPADSLVDRERSLSRAELAWVRHERRSRSTSRRERR